MCFHNRQCFVPWRQPVSVELLYSKSVLKRSINAVQGNHAFRTHERKRVNLPKFPLKIQLRPHTCWVIPCVESATYTRYSARKITRLSHRKSRWRKPDWTTRLRPTASKCKARARVKTLTNNRAMSYLGERAMWNSGEGRLQARS